MVSGSDPGLGTLVTEEIAMFQLHAVDASNRGRYHAHIEAHYRIRHDIYVGERGWRDLERPDGREVDAFDTDAAIHLLGIMPARGVVAGSRLVPTLEPTLMSEVFPQLAQGGPPRAADIYEWTRFFVVPALRQSGRPGAAAGIVYCGLLEYCLARRIRKLSIVCESYWHDRLAALGWRPRRLGKRLRHDNADIIGLLVAITPEALATTRAAYRIDRPMLYRAPGLVREVQIGQAREAMDGRKARVCSDPVRS